MGFECDKYTKVGLMKLKILGARSSMVAVLFLLLASIFQVNGISAEQDGNKIVSDAHALVKAVKPEDTSYIHKNVAVSWGNDGKAVCHADCSALLNALLLHSGYFSEEDLKKHLGAARPLAKHYHDAIIHHRGFKEITSIEEVRPGDIIAIKYPPGSGNTGHVMLVVAQPTKRAATEPVVKNSIQYEIEIIDCSSSGHGPNDSRRIESGKYREGLGKGMYRVFTNEKGIPIGHSWSVYATSKYYEMNVRNLVIGRVDR